jgi:hypothetical protein
MMRGTQGFRSTGLEEILNTRIISSVKVIKFHSEFYQYVKNKAFQDDRYQLFLNTNPEDKDRTSRDELIYFKEYLQILDVEKVQLEIAESEHNSKVAEHYGEKKTLKLVSRNFY